MAPSQKSMRPLPHVTAFRLLEKTTLIEGDGKSVLPVRQYTFELPPDETVGIDSGRGEYIKVFPKLASKPKPYSITSDPERRGSFDLTVKLYPKGVVSGYIDSVPVGRSIRMSGPFPPPVFFKRRLQGRYVCLVIMGIGITEGLRVAMAELECGAVESVTMLYANRLRADVLFESELRDLQERHAPRFQLISIFSQEDVEGALRGRVDDEKLSSAFELESAGEKFDEARFLVVGSKPFKKDMWRLLQGMGYSKERHALLVKGWKER